MHRADKGTKRSHRRFKTVVLPSGGIDSTSCLWYYLRRGFRAQALFVDYGQISSKRELRAARLVCNHFRVPLKVVELNGTVPHGPGLIRGRNGFLLLTAMMESEINKGVIALGIHAGTEYKGCSSRICARSANGFRYLHRRLHPNWGAVLTLEGKRHLDVRETGGRAAAFNLQLRSAA
jgi:Queuosine biosynthesis protein QueC